MKVEYKEAKIMEPRNGNSFATTYFKLTAIDSDDVKLHIHKVLTGIYEVQRADPFKYDFVDTPMKGFKRLGKHPNYSIMDIVTDMAQQLIDGKDIPSGMLGRWNKIFNDTEWDIEIIKPGTKSIPYQNKLTELFGAKK